MRNEWRKLRWGDIATLEYGKGLRDYASNTGPYPVYGTNGPIGWHSEALCPYPGVIIGRKGAYRGVVYSDRPFYVIDTAFYLKPKTEIDLRWAYYQLLTHDINGMDSGSAIPSTSRSDFYGLPVVVPPLEAQHAIASMLGSLDDKIELNRRMNATLEAMARALFRSWFVDFDPVRAKMEGREPFGMDAATAALFPAALDDSTLGTIPQGWRVSTIGEGYTLVMGQSPPSEHYNTEGRGLPFHQGVTNFGERYATHKTYTTITERVAATGDVLVSVRAPVGRINVADTAIVLGRGLSSLRHKHNHQTFALYQLLDAFREEDSIGSGTIYTAATKGDMLNVKVLVPPLTVVAEFEYSAKPLDEQIRLNTEQSRTLAALRNALLPHLLSGAMTFNFTHGTDDEG